MWKDYMERIMKKEDGWDHNEEEDAVEEPVECVSGDEVLNEGVK